MMYLISGLLEYEDGIWCSYDHHICVTHNRVILSPPIHDTSEIGELSKFIRRDAVIYEDINLEEISTGVYQFNGLIIWGTMP